MKRITLENRIEDAAFHEAGHAIAGLAHGFWIRDRGISIAHGGAGEADIRGCIVADPCKDFSSLSPEVLRILNAHCIVAMAGLQSELLNRRVRGSYTITGPLAPGDDFVRILRYLRIMTGRGTTDTGTDLYLSLLISETKQILRERRTWAAISEVAVSLAQRQRISAEEVEDIFIRNRVPIRTVARLVNPAGARDLAARTKRARPGAGS